MIRTARILMAGLLCTTSLAACGGGSENGPAQKPTQKMVAVMRTTPLSTPSTPIAAISATLTMPDWATVKTVSTDPFQPDPSVVQLLSSSQSATTVQPTYIYSRYSAATDTNPGKLKFTVMDVRGFTSAEQIAINLDITSIPANFDPLFSYFTLVDYSFSDINGLLLTSITPQLSVTFMYTITASSGANGTVSPMGAKMVGHGTSQVYTITPATGYHVADVIVDGKSAGAVTSYTFSNVTDNHTISATFAIN